MAGKTYMKTGQYSWSRIKKIYLKEGATTWRAIRKAYIKTGSTTWRKVFDTASNRPYLANSDRPRIRLNSYRSAGYVEAEPVQMMGPSTGYSNGWPLGAIGSRLYGADAGTLSNWVSGGGSSMTSTYQWLYSPSTDPNTQVVLTGQNATGQPTDTFENDESHIASYDGKYLWFKPTYTNASGSTSAVSNSVLIVKQPPSYNWFYISNPASGISLNQAITITWNIAAYWYNSIDYINSRIEWYLESSNISPLFDSSTRVKTEYIYLSNYIFGTNDISGTSTYTPTSAAGASGKYLYARLILVNSYTNYLYGNNVGNAVSTINRGPIAQAPTVDVYPTITKLDGYLTVIGLDSLYTNDTTDGTPYTQCRIRGNTGQYTPDPTSVDSKFQYSSDQSVWTTFYDSGGIYQSFTDTSENVNHDYYLEDYFYTTSAGLIPNNNSNRVSTSAKYIRFGANAYNQSASTGNNYAQLGPIYAAPTAPGIPNITVGSTYSSSQRYISVWWNYSATKYTYYFQVYQGGQWVTLWSGTTDTFNGAYYTPISVLAPIGNYNYRVINKNSEGVYAKSASVLYNLTAPYTFSMGNTIYVSTNGHIELDSGSTSSTIPTTGRSISIFPADLVQTGLTVWSNTTQFVIRYTGYQYGQSNTAAYQLDYQVLFDTANNYVDIYYNSKGSSLFSATAVGYYTNGVSSGVPGPYAISAGTRLRLYFDGSTTGSFGLSSILPVDPTYFVNTAGITSGTTDDGYTAITTSANQTVPVNQTRPLLSLVSGTANQTGSTYRLSSGTWTGSPTQYRYRLEINNASGTIITEYPSSTTWTTNTSFDYTFTSSTTNSVSGVVTAYNGYSSYGAYSSNSIGPITVPNLTAPTISSVSAGNVSGAVTVYFSGGSGPYYQIYWTASSTAPTSAVTPDASGSSSPLTDSTGPGTVGPWYVYVRSVSTTGETSVGPSTVASAWSAGTQFSMTQPVPVNQTIPTLTPSSIAVGTVLTFGVGTWSNSPTSYDLRLYRGTAGVLTSETLVKSAGNVTSSTYTVTQADYDSGQRYFRAYASATNAGGTSNSGVLTAGTEVGPIATPVSKPSGGTISLSGTAKVGQTITATTSGWSGSPTSYDTRIVRGTQYVVIGETLKASSTTSSVSYNIQSADIGYYFKGFAYAANSAGTSDSYATSNEIGPVTAAGSAPSNPTITGNNSLAVGGTFSWSSTGTGPITYAFSVYGPSGSLQYSTYGSYVSTTSFRPGYDATWAGAGNYTIYVYAHNSNGDSGVSQLTTYMS